MKTTLESFVTAGAAAQAAVDLVTPRVRARAALEAIADTTLDDVRCLSDYDVQVLARRARSLAALAEFECGRREALSFQASLTLSAAAVAPAATAADLAREQLLGVLWSNLTPAPRLALCALVYIEDDYTRTPWIYIPVVDRVRLVLSMRMLSEIAVECARTLERAALAEFRP